MSLPNEMLANAKNSGVPQAIEAVSSERQDHALNGESGRGMVCRVANGFRKGGAAGRAKAHTEVLAAPE